MDVILPPFLSSAFLQLSRFTYILRACDFVHSANTRKSWRVSTKEKSVFQIVLRYERQNWLWITKTIATNPRGGRMLLTKMLQYHENSSRSRSFHETVDGDRERMQLFGTKITSQPPASPPTINARWTAQPLVPGPLVSRLVICRAEC